MFSSAIKTGIASHRPYFVARKKLFSGQLRRFGFIDLLELPGNRLPLLQISPRTYYRWKKKGFTKSLRRSFTEKEQRLIQEFVTLIRLILRPIFYWKRVLGYS